MPRNPRITRDALHAAALDLLAEYGPAGLSLRALAERLGVRPPSLHKHIGGLDGLHHELRVYGLHALGAMIAQTLESQPGIAGLRALALAWRDFARARPGLYALTLATTAHDDPELRRIGEAALAPVLAALAGCGLRGSTAIHAARTLRAGLHGFVALEQAGGFGLAEDVATSYRWMIDALLAGILQQAQEASSEFPHPIQETT